MKLQRDESFILADRIVEIVEEYILGKTALDGDTFILINAESRDVCLGNGDDANPGVKIPISDFILEEQGKLIPDYDQIDCFAASWR